MKKLLLLILVAVIVLPTVSMFAQQTERELKKEIKDKAIREARKEAKKMKKDGWYVPPGSLPLEKIIENAWMKQYQEDENGNQLYITADGNAVAESKTAGEMQAIEMGKLQLAGLIETNVSSLISGNIGNAQLSTEDAASVTEIVQSSKNIIATQLGYVNPFFKLHRDIGKDKIEVQVRLFYDVRQSLEIAKKVVRKELEDKLQMNEEKLEQLMGM
jgi:type II secretory pathway pseudopilin PulG